MKTKKERIFWFFDNGTFIFGFAAYLFGLLFLYLYAFNVYDGMYDAIHLASINRFINIFYLAWWLVIYQGILQIFLYNGIIQSRKLQYSLMGVMLIIFSIGLIIVYLPQYQLTIHKRDCRLFRRDIQGVIQKIKKYTKATNSIFIVFQEDAGFHKLILAYDLIPRNFNIVGSSFGTPYFDNDILTQNVTSKQLLNQISSFNYLFLAYTDKKFWDTYGNLFSSMPPKLKSFASYTACAGKGFGLMRQSGCHFQTFQTYLFKVIHNKNKIILKNVIS